jgi:hypothetical protein
MDTINYPYANGELLENPQRYSYSGYFGEVFISSWQCHRDNQLASLPKAQALIQINGEPLSPNNTLRSLHAICERLRNPQLLVDSDSVKWLQRILKKFEVTKRVYSAYNQDEPYLPMAGSSYTCLEVYIKLAECFILAFNKGGELQYLNAFIKIQDSIISQTDRLSHTSKTNLAWLIQQEVKTLAQLMTSKGLT